MHLTELHIGTLELRKFKNAHDLLGLNYECIILYKEFNGTKSRFIEVITYDWEQY